MLYLKAMSSQDLPDGHPQKHFTLYPIPDNSALSFGSSDVNPHGTRAVWFGSEGLRAIELVGNAYVMNDQGRTIASHTPGQCNDHAPAGAPQC